MQAETLPGTRFTSAFTAREWRTLNTLRTRYERSQDALGTHDLQRLDFVRWLYLSGRIEP